MAQMENFFLAASALRATSQCCGNTSKVGGGSRNKQQGMGIFQFDIAIKGRSLPLNVTEI